MVVMPPPNQSLKLRESSKPTESRVQDNIAATVTPIATRLNATPIMGAPPPAWVTPDIILASGYVQSPSTAAIPLPQTSYHRDALGYVHGKVALLTAAGTAGGNVAFTIAKGSLPGDLLPFLMSDGGGNVWDVTVSPDGNFTVVSVVGAGGLVAGTFTYLAER